MRLQLIITLLFPLLLAWLLLSTEAQTPYNYVLFGCLASVLTFEKDELALAVFIDSVYLGWQTSPEHVDEHGIAWHYCVVSDPPKPMILKEIHYNTVKQAVKKNEVNTANQDFWHSLKGFLRTREYMKLCIKSGVLLRPQTISLTLQTTVQSQGCVRSPSAPLPLEFHLVWPH